MPWIELFQACIVGLEVQEASQNSCSTQDCMLWELVSKICNLDNDVK